MFGFIVFTVLFTNVISEGFYENQSQNVPKNPSRFSDLWRIPHIPRVHRGLRTDQSLRVRQGNFFNDNTRSGFEPAEDTDFSIEIQRTYYNGNHGGPIPCSHNCKFYFEDGDTIELTCKRKEIGTIKWKDTYGFMRSAIQDNAFKLKITPDAEDADQNLTCVIYEKDVLKNITVTLVVSNSSNIKTSLRRITLEIGKPWTSSECFGFAFYPIIKSNTAIYDVTKFNDYANHTIIKSFNESLDGTIFKCIQYKAVSNTFHSGNGIQEKVFTYQRLKTIYIFHLEHGSARNRQTNVLVKTNTQAANDQVETNMQEKSANPAEGIASDSQSNSTAILGGVLGTIIIVLSCLLIGICYKSIRQRPPDDGATEAIYTEIAEKLTAKPTAPPTPPPRTKNLYAKMVDTPNQQTQPNDDSYATIKCEKGTEKGDQHSTVKRQTVDVNKHTSKPQTQPSENLYCIVK